MSDVRRSLPPSQEPATAAVLRHSLGWLVVGNGVGVLLSLLLLRPEIGHLLSPLTYGRWMSVHLDTQLYGWCSLPIVGLFLRVFWYPSANDKALSSPWPQRAVQVWTGGLLVGVFSWLGGQSSGKLFLDWTGPARIWWTLTLAFLAVVLAAGWWRQASAPEPNRGRLLGLALLWLPLGLVPLILYQASSPRVYPPINPDSGGATGGDLLGSTLGIVLLFLLLPHLLELPERLDRSTSWLLRPPMLGALLAFHGAGFFLLGFGDRSHHEPAQIIALASIAPWWILLRLHLRRFRWPAPSRPWLGAMALWGGLLWLNGFVTFLPGVLDNAKFTNALVGHAHLAMAGLVTSLMIVVLAELAAGSPWRDLFADRSAFVLWQVGCLSQILVLLAVGVLEARQPGVLFDHDPTIRALYSARLLAGLMMTWASLRWARRSWISYPDQVTSETKLPVRDPISVSAKDGGEMGSLENPCLR